MDTDLQKHTMNRQKKKQRFIIIDLKSEYIAISQKFLFFTYARLKKKTQNQHNEYNGKMKDNHS